MPLSDCQEEEMSVVSQSFPDDEWSMHISTSKTYIMFIQRIFGIDDTNTVVSGKMHARQVIRKWSV